MKMKMKWFLCLMPLLVVTVLLLGCGSTIEQSTPSHTPVPSPQPTPEPQSQAPSVNETTSTTSSQVPSVNETTSTSSSQAISWDEAKYHIGERAIVCGPVVNTKYDHEVWGKPTFLHIGKPYPAPHRFTVVIWDTDRSNFAKAPERYYVGKTIWVRGLIMEDKGVPQIEVKTPSQVQEQ